MATARRLAILLALVGPAGAVPQNYVIEDAAPINGLSVRQTAEADSAVVFAIAQIVSETRLVCYDDLGLGGPDTVQVRVAKVDTAFPCALTDRAETVYANYGGDGYLGERRRGRTGAVGVICYETAELYNPHRLPGLELYIAYCLAAPRVDETLGAEAWPQPYNVLATDGPTAFRQRILRPEYLAEHPDWAAASAWSRIVDVLGTAWLATQVNALTADGANAVTQLREAAVASKPELGPAFDAWDKATAWTPDVGNSRLITSFESEDDRGGLLDLARAEFEITESWSTDAKHAGEVTFLAGTWPWIRVADSDWRYGDWSSFKTLELDIRNLGTETIPLTVEAFDRLDRCHGWLYGWFDVPAGATHHLVLQLRPTNQDAGQRVGANRHAPWFDGEFRYGEVAELAITARQGPAYPYQFLVDNLRLVP